MHDDIHRFTRRGQTGDDHVQTKDWHVRDLETEMRGTGFVPALDLYPQYTVEYDSETETFDFVLTVYGVYVGEGESCKLIGVTDGKKITRSTPRIK